MRKLNHLIAIAISLTVLVLASCGSGFVEGATTDGDISKTVVKTVTFTAYGDEGIVSFPIKEAEGARTIVPTALDGRNLFYYYWGDDILLGTENTTIKIPKKISFYADANSYGRTGAVELDLPTSQYKLYLYATSEEITLTGTSATDISAITAKTVLTATATVDLRYNEKVNFYLTPYAVNGNGSISLTVYTNWEINPVFLSSTSGSIQFSINKVTDNSLATAECTKTLSDTEIGAMNNQKPSAANWTVSTIPAGTYNFKVKFTNSTKTPAQEFYYSDTIIILANQVTAQEIILPPVTGKAPEAPSDFTVRYIDPENATTNYYNAEFLWKDNSYSEQFFQIDLMDVTEMNDGEDLTLSDANWATLAAVTAKHPVISYTNKIYSQVDKDGTYVGGYVAGNLNANSDFLVLNLELGKRYIARISAVNDAGASSYVYQNFSIVEPTGATPASGEIASKAYRREGASTDVSVSDIKIFDSTAPAINRFRINYHLVKGSYYTTTYGANDEIDTITFTTAATKTNISTLDPGPDDPQPDSDVRYYTFTPVVLNAGAWQSGGNFILNPLKVEGNVAGTYYSLAKNKTSWTGWKLNSVSGATIYQLDDANTTTAKPIQRLVNKQTDTALTDKYKTPYDGWANLDLFAVYGRADVSIYNPADKVILDTDILIFKNSSNDLTNAVQVATIDEANAFRVNNNPTSGFKYLFIAVRNKNYSKIKMTIADQGNGVRFESEGTSKQTFNADRYVLLTKEPEDWSAGYASYYKKDKRAYTALASAETFAANTFYRKEVADTSNNSFTYFTVPIATEYAPGSAYTLTLYAYTINNTKTPFTMPITMSIIDSATPEYSPTTFEPLDYASKSTNYVKGDLTTAPTTWAVGEVGTGGAGNTGVWQKD